MVTVKDIYNAIDSFAPYRLAQKWDNSGIMCGGNEVTKALISLDFSSRVVLEAEAKECQLVINHHPALFEGVKKLMPEDPVYMAVRRGIAVLSAHTNVDAALLNDCLAEKLGLKNVTKLAADGIDYSNKLVVFVPENYSEKVYDALSAAGAGQLGGYSSCAFISRGEGRFKPLEGAVPAVGEINRIAKVPEVRIEMIVHPRETDKVIAAMKEVHPYETPAYDLFSDKATFIENAIPRIGELETPCTPYEFAKMVKEALGCDAVSYCDAKRTIKKVAVCGGAGSSFLNDVLMADAYVTGDVKHDTYLAALEKGITIVDAGHFFTEDIIVGELKTRLQSIFPEVCFETAECDLSPIKHI